MAVSGHLILWSLAFLTVLARLVTEQTNGERGTVRLFASYRSFAEPFTSNTSNTTSLYCVVLLIQLAEPYCVATQSIYVVLIVLYCLCCQGPRTLRTACVPYKPCRRRSLFEGAVIPPFEVKLIQAIWGRSVVL